MFMLSQGAGTNFAFPDVCNTYVGEAEMPMTYPNFNMSATTAPAAYNVLVDCMPTSNQLSLGLMSNGDEIGILGGMVSAMIDGQTEYIVGCVTILVDGIPAQRLTSMTGQNCMGVSPNTVGNCLCPSQVTVLTLG